MAYADRYIDCYLFSAHVRTCYAAIMLEHAQTPLTSIKIAAARPASCRSCMNVGRTYARHKSHAVDLGLSRKLAASQIEFVEPSKDYMKDTAAAPNIIVKQFIMTTFCNHDQYIGSRAYQQSGCWKIVEGAACWPTEAPKVA